MTDRDVMLVKLSDVAEPFMLAALDLLETVLHTDPSMLTIHVYAKAVALREIVENGSGRL